MKRSNTGSLPVPVAGVSDSGGGLGDEANVMVDPLMDGVVVVFSDRCHLRPVIRRSGSCVVFDRPAFHRAKAANDSNCDTTA